MPEITEQVPRSEAVSGFRETPAPESGDKVLLRVEGEALAYVLAAARNGGVEAVFTQIDAAGVTAAGFADRVHADIFAAIEQLYASRAVITPTRVAEVTPVERREPVLQAVELLALAPTVDPGTFQEHLAALAREGHRRDLDGAARRACADLEAGRDPEDVEDALRTAMLRRDITGRRVRSQAERWDSLARHFEPACGPIALGAAFRLREPPLAPAPNCREHSAATAWRAAGRPTLAGLLNGGLHPGELIALGGGVGTGKSTFALQLADAIAADNLPQAEGGREFVPVLYVALELDGADLLEMSLARLACVNVGVVHAGSTAHGSAPEDLQERLAAAQASYRETIGPYLRVLDSEFYAYEDVTLDAVRRQVRRAKADFAAPTAAVFIDPLQRLMTGRPEVDADPVARVAALARGLLAMARCENVAVVALVDTVRPTAETGRELPVRGTYVLNHLASTTLYLDAGGEVRELFPELWKRDRYMKFMYAGDQQHADEFTYHQKQLARRLEEHRNFPLAGDGYDYRRDYRSLYAALLCFKRRWEEPFSPIFHYHQAIKCFEELPV